MSPYSLRAPSGCFKIPILCKLQPPTAPRLLDFRTNGYHCLDHRIHESTTSVHHLISSNDEHSAEPAFSKPASMPGKLSPRANWPCRNSPTMLRLSESISESDEGDQSKGAASHTWCWIRWYQKNGPITSIIIDRIRETGCLIVRNVIPGPEATQYPEHLKSYVSRNPGRFTGFPADHPSMYNMYNTPS